MKQAAALILAALVVLQLSTRVLCAPAGQAKANLRAEKVLEEVENLVKRLQQVEADLEANKENLEQANKDLEEREKSLTNAKSEVAALIMKVQLIKEDLERSEERL